MVFYGECFDEVLVLDVDVKVGSVGREHYIPVSRPLKILYMIYIHVLL